MIPTASDQSSLAPYIACLNIFTDGNGHKGKNVAELSSLSQGTDLHDRWSTERHGWHARCNDSNRNFPDLFMYFVQEMKTTKGNSRQCKGQLQRQMRASCCNSSIMVLVTPSRTSDFCVVLTFYATVAQNNKNNRTKFIK